MADRTRERKKISDEVLDELLAGQDVAEVFRSGTMVDDLKEAGAECALDAEMEAHLEREDREAAGNHRDGHNRGLRIGSPQTANRPHRVSPRLSPFRPAGPTRRLASRQTPTTSLVRRPKAPSPIPSTLAGPAPAQSARRGRAPLEWTTSRSTPSASGTSAWRTHTVSSSNQRQIRRRRRRPRRTGAARPSRHRPRPRQRAVSAMRVVLR